MFAGAKAIDRDVELFAGPVGNAVGGFYGSPRTGVKRILAAAQRRGLINHVGVHFHVIVIAARGAQS